MNTTNTKDKIQILYFMIKNVRACAELEYIYKVISLTQLEIVPGGPQYLAGILNLHGHSIPIIDLALRLNLSREKKHTLDTPIVICHVGNRYMGMIVDKIIDLVTLDNKFLQMHEQFNNSQLPFIGVLQINTDLSLLLDMKRILEHQLAGKSDEFIVDKELMNMVANHE